MGISYEVMQAIAERVAKALRAEGFDGVTVLPFDPGELPVVMFDDADGFEFGIEIAPA